MGLEGIKTDGQKGEICSLKSCMSGNEKACKAKKDERSLREVTKFYID